MARTEETFGEMLRRLRESYFGLREFADLIGEKAPNLSAIENGQRKPWTDVERLRLVASRLGLAEGSTDWARFFNLARRPGQLPPDIIETGELDVVFSLLRTVQGRQLTEKELRDFVVEIKRQNEISTLRH